MHGLFTLLRSAMYHLLVTLKSRIMNVVSVTVATKKEIIRAVIFALLAVIAIVGCVVAGVVVSNRVHDCTTNNGTSEKVRNLKNMLLLIFWKFYFGSDVIDCFFRSAP